MNNRSDDFYCDTYSIFLMINKKRYDDNDDNGEDNGDSIDDDDDDFNDKNHTLSLTLHNLELYSV